MSFQQGLSGLNATSKNLEIIGNNIANSNTFGSKVSRGEFSDVLHILIRRVSVPEFREPTRHCESPRCRLGQGDRRARGRSGDWQPHYPGDRGGRARARGRTRTRVSAPDPRSARRTGARMTDPSAGRTMAANARAGRARRSRLP